MGSGSAFCLLLGTLHWNSLGFSQQHAGIDIHGAVDIFDAPKNVEIREPDDYSNQVEDFIKDELLSYCENKKFISDIIGDGPKQI